MTTHNFEKGDFIILLGSVVKVTDKAICIEFHNGKWLGGKMISKWIPKSALIIHTVKDGKGLLNDESKKCIEADFKPWFKL